MYICTHTCITTWGQVSRKIRSPKYDESCYDSSSSRTKRKKTKNNRKKQK